MYPLQEDVEELEEEEDLEEKEYEGKRMMTRGRKRRMKKLNTKMTKRWRIRKDSKVEGSSTSITLSGPARQ